MLQRLISFFKSLLETKTYNSIEEFIASHNPQSTADVEHLFQLWEERQRAIARAITEHDYARANWIRGQY